MKHILLILFLIVANSKTPATVSFLPKSKRYKKKKVIQTVKIRRSAIKKNKRFKRVDSELKRQNTELKALLSKRLDRPLIVDGTNIIPTGTVIKSRLLNSIVSTNLESPVLIEVIEDNDYIEIGSRFSCAGSTKHKRVQTVCSKLIEGNFEADVNVVALNLDGSAGLKGEYYEGKEAYVAGMLVANLATGILGASQDSITTSLGQITANSTKNKMLEGLMQTAQTGNELLKDELKTTEPVVVVEAGKEVILYFQSRFKRRGNKRGY